jgi:predicted nucleotidyltransferase
MNHPNLSGWFFSIHSKEKRNSVNQGIKKKLGEYFAHKPVVSAYVFGSFAQGSTTKKSNVDILLELDYSKPIGLEFVQMQLDLEKLFGEKVDLVTTKGISQRILPLIEKEKKLIYAR